MVFILIKQEKIKDFLKQNNVDAVMVCKDENYRYISGFTGSDSYLLLTGDVSYLITDSRYTEQAEAEAQGMQVVNHKGKLADVVKKLADAHQVRRLGVEKGMTYGLYLRLDDAMPDKEFLVVTPDVLRQIKTEEELRNIAEACRISDEGFRKTLPYIKAGKTENELRRILECAMLEAGSEGRSFEIIVASGVRSSMPHGIATDKVVQEGELITFDFGAIYRGYHSDITRTVAVGTISDRLRYIYDSVLECNLTVERMLRAGLKACDVDAKAREYLKSCDLDQYFTHSLGHSVGLEIHETPVLSPRDETILVPGMTETVEPGVYIPNVGGVRIEDTVAIKENGIDILTGFPKNFIKV